MQVLRMLPVRLALAGAICVALAPAQAARGPRNLVLPVTAQGAVGPLLVRSYETFIRRHVELRFGEPLAGPIVARALDRIPSIERCAVSTSCLANLADELRATDIYIGEIFAEADGALALTLQRFAAAAGRIVSSASRPYKAREPMEEAVEELLARLGSDTALDDALPLESLAAAPKTVPTSPAHATDGDDLELIAPLAGPAPVRASGSQRSTGSGEGLASPPEPALARPTVTAPPSEPSWQRLAGYSSGAAGAVALGAGLYFGWRSISLGNEAERLRNRALNGGSVSGTQVEDKLAGNHRAHDLATALYAVGVTLAAVGGGLWVYDAYLARAEVTIDAGVTGGGVSVRAAW